MQSSFLIRCVLATMLLAGIPLLAGAQEPNTEQPNTEQPRTGEADTEEADTEEADTEEAAIRARVASYLEAYQRRDAAAMAAHWSPAAEYTSSTSGERVKGREAIQAEFEALFAAGPAPELEVTLSSIRFLTQDVALEEGIARITPVDEAPTRSSYTAIHVKRDGTWLLESLRETPLPTPTSNYEYLKPLEWMIGEWVDEDDSATVTTRCEWTKNKNFLTRSFDVKVEGRIEMQGTQVIGWDAAKQKIRSWVFDSDGGFAEGTWTNHENRWTIHSHGTFPDGRTGSTLTIITRLDDDTVTWAAVGREVAGEILPDIEPVTVVRKK